MKYLHNDRELLGAPRGHRTGVGKSACDGMIFSGGGGGRGDISKQVLFVLL